MISRAPLSNGNPYFKNPRIDYHEHVDETICQYKAGKHCHFVYCLSKKLTN